jgi:hypothetical protein
MALLARALAAAAAAAVALLPAPVPSAHRPQQYQQGLCALGALLQLCAELVRALWSQYRR